MHMPSTPSEAALSTLETDSRKMSGDLSQSDAAMPTPACDSVTLQNRLPLHTVAFFDFTSLPRADPKPRFDADHPNAA